MTEPVNNNQWLSDTLDMFFIMRAGTPNDDLEELKLRNELGEPKAELKHLLLSKLESIEQEARLSELINLPLNDGRFSDDWIREHWEARIAALQQERIRRSND